MKNELVFENDNIKNMIFEVRGKQVIADRDLARLYEIETKVLNQTVKRNVNRFPNEFCFQLNEDEFKNWRSQFVTSKNDKMGLRRPPYVFTEHGIIMLAGLLNSDKAIEVNLKIVNIFVMMRKQLNMNYLYESIDRINNKLRDHDEDINYIKNLFKKDEILFLKNQEYDAYSYIIDIMNKSKKEVIVVDPYADKTFLDIIRNIKSDVTLITSNKNRLTETQIIKYNKEYTNLKIMYTNIFHDRYIIIDKNIIYHSGTSINNMGNKITTITELKDQNVFNVILDEINKVISTCT